jgi:hypothetical protein
MGEHEEYILLHNAFLQSREGAIVRCASIMFDSGRKDLAKQILETTKIDRNKFEKIKAQNA